MKTCQDSVLSYRTLIGAAVCFILYFGIQALPLAGFSSQAHTVMAVFAVAAFLWLTNILPLAVTGIVVLLLLPLSGAVSAGQAYSFFGNSSVFFVLGAFILASPVKRSGLSTRFSLVIITKLAKGPVSLLFAIFSLSAGLAFIISEHAVAAMLYPIVTEIIDASGVSLKSRFGFALVLAMGWGAIIGGTATLLGGARAPLALGMLKESTGQTLSFFGWMRYAFPITACLLVIGFTIIFFIAHKSQAPILKARKKLKNHHLALGKLSVREVVTALILLLTVVLWLTDGGKVGLDLIALIGVILVFIFKVANWKEVEEDVQWSIFLVYGSAIALGSVLKSTGAATACVNLIVSSGVHSPFVIFSTLILLTYLLTEAMSNAAAVAVLIPIGLVLAKQYHIDPQALTVVVASAAGFAFMLPVSTPAMAIITSHPMCPPHKALKYGFLIKACGLLVLLSMFWLIWPLMGLATFSSV